MFGWKGYGFYEEATEANLNGKGDVWNLIKMFKPFVKYKQTLLMRDKETDEVKGTLDLVKCPKWVGSAIDHWLALKNGTTPGSFTTVEIHTDKVTGQVTKFQEIKK